MDAEDKISTAMSRKLTLKSSVSLKSAMTQRLPNMSRKQQEQLKRQLYLQETAAATSKDKKRRRATESSDDEDEEDDGNVRFGSDGKLHIGADENESSAVGDMDKIYRAAMSSFKRSADGKHVKFARGTKANRDEDFEDEDDDRRGSGDATKSTAAFSGMSRKTALSSLSNRTGKSVRSASTSISHAHSGSQFRAKKGSAGDAKRKGAQFDPYAYVPIQRKSGKHGGGRKENVHEKYFMKNNKRARN
jgi:hypothetical protein